MSRTSPGRIQAKLAPRKAACIRSRVLGPTSGITDGETQGPVGHGFRHLLTNPAARAHTVAARQIPGALIAGFEVLYLLFRFLAGNPIAFLEFSD